MPVRGGAAAAAAEVVARLAAALLGAVLLAAALPVGGPAWSASPSGQTVRFPASDGIMLAGTLFGMGTAGVVLAHMFPTDQRSWHPLARQLAAEGYRALAFDFRGYGRSGGTRQVDLIDRDVRGAAALLRAKGVARMVLVGASMGGTAVVKAAAKDGAAALVVLSAPLSFRGLTVTPVELSRLTMPSLWITSADDGATAGMRAMHAAAPGPKTLHVYAGGAHGTFLFDTPLGPDLTGRILVFVGRHVPPQ